MRRSSTQSKYQRRFRANRALFAGILYLLGMVVLPSLHLGFHRDDHDHHAGGLRWLHSAADRYASLPAHAHSHGPIAESAESSTTLTPLAADDEQQPSIVANGSAVDGKSARLATASTSHGTPGDLAHGLGSLAHFASAYLAASQGLHVLPVRLHVERMAARLTSQHVVSQPFLSCLRSRAPPHSSAV